MSKSYLIISLSLLLMVLGGCKDSKKAEQPTEKPPQTTANQNKQPEKQDFKDPLEKGETPSRSTVVTSTLIPATNPDQRANSVPKGSSSPNRNPFGVIIPPIFLPEESNDISPLPESGDNNSSGGQTTTGKTTTGKTTTGKTTTGKTTTGKTTTGKTTTGKTTTGKTTTGKTTTGKTTTGKQRNRPVIQQENPIATTSGLNRTPSSQKSLPGNIIVPPPPIAIIDVTPDFPNNPSGKLPNRRGIPYVKPDFSLNPAPKPEPDQARQVVITGIIDINGINHAIVKAPGEKDSRYVKAGDLLANGMVLVKQIDTNSNKVTLEQLGQNVELAIGSNSSASKTN